MAVTRNQAHDTLIRLHMIEVRHILLGIIGVTVLSPTVFKNGFYFITSTGCNGIVQTIIQH